jgi:hypothetical protein
MPVNSDCEDLKPATVQRAIRLVATNKDGGDVDWIDKDKQEIGITKGSKTLPVYFNNGIPEECYNAGSPTMIDFRYPNIDNVVNSYAEDKMLKATAYTYGKVGTGSGED